MPVHPGDVIICRQSCAEPGFGLFTMHILPHDVAFTDGARRCLAGEIDACICQDRQAKMYSNRDSFL